MDKFLGQEQPEEDRWQFIQDNADAIEEIGYTHRFTPEELAQYNPQNQKSRFQKRKIKKNGKRFVDSLYSLIDLKTI